MNSAPASSSSVIGAAAFSRQTLPVPMKSEDCPDLIAQSAGFSRFASSSPDTSQSTIEADSIAAHQHPHPHPHPHSHQSPHKKRRYKVQLNHRPEQYRCHVCGDNALGFNFDAITCESCKAFFRRNAFKNGDLKCKFDGACVISINTRKFCSPCRLEKCLLVGMKKEWILSEPQLQQRRLKTLCNRSRRYASEASNSGAACSLSDNEPITPTNGPAAAGSSAAETECFVSPSSSSAGTALDLATDSPIHVQPGPEPQSGVGEVPHVTVLTVLDECSTGCEAADQQRWQRFRPLSDTCARLISDIRTSLRDTVNSVENKDSVDICSAASESTTSLETPFAITHNFVQRFVSFVKRLPEYSLIDQTDMITLIKGGVFQFILMRGVAIYDPDKDCFAFQSKAMGNRVHSLPLSVLSQALGSCPGGQLLVQHYRQFMIDYHKASSGDHLALTLLQLIEFFNSARPLLGNMERVDRIHQGYILLLKRYIESVHPVQQSRRIFFDLMNRLSELDSIAAEFSQLCHAVGFRCDSLKPLLREIFELNEDATASATAVPTEPAPSPERPPPHQPLHHLQHLYQQQQQQQQQQHYHQQLFTAAANFFQQQQQQQRQHPSFVFKTEPALPR